MTESRPEVERGPGPANRTRGISLPGPSVRDECGPLKVGPHCWSHRRGQHSKLPVTPLDRSRSCGRTLDMRQLGPRPTLGELQRSTAWVWLWCERCQYHAPFACAVAVIRWGPNASTDKLRVGARWRHERRHPPASRMGWQSCRLSSFSHRVPDENG
jgi:hypothetical protein